MNAVMALRIILDLFFYFAERAGLAEEERDKLYGAKKAEYNALPDPANLKDV